MQEIIEKNKCCGCHACMNICPKSAITMESDSKGFKYPVINQEKCINCGMCKKVCPVLNNKEDLYKKTTAYACYNNNLEDRLNSSSGGIFILLAKEIIKNNGVVFGAGFDKKLNVKHSYIENEKDLKNFMGSKYVQSIIGDTYKEAKKFLDDDRYVLFSGTPCQIEGLKSYLKKEYDKLYTQDIICHGVPSPKVWKKYLEYQQNNNKSNIKSVSFRNKDKGWASFCTKILFDKGEYCKTHSKDLFMQSFLNNVCLRDSCYNCSFKKKYRESDITLADYWGINNEHPNMNDDKGISLLIINSKKGQKLFNMIKNDIKYEKTNLENAIKYNSAMINSVSHCAGEDDFFNNINTVNFGKLVNKCIPKTSLYKQIIKFIKNDIKFLLCKLKIMKWLK